MIRALIRMLVVGALALPASALAAKSTKPKMMLLDIPAEEGMKPATIKVFNEFLANDLRKQGFDVVTSQDITAVLGIERQKQLMGCSESNCLAEIGGALGADFIVRGTVAPLGSRMALTLTVLDSKGAALNQERELLKSKDEGDLVEAMEAMVPHLVAPVKARLAPSAKPEAAASAQPAGGLQSSAQAEAGGTSGGKIAGFALLGVGAAALIGSGVVGLLARNQATDANTHAQQATAGTDPVAEYGTAQTEGWISTGLLAGGVVAAGVGAVLVLVSGPSKAESAMTLTPAGTALALNF